MNLASDAPAGVAFGRCRVLPRRREVLADGQPIKLGGRAFDVLMALIEARGEIVGKDVLMARVWPGRVVEEPQSRGPDLGVARRLLAEQDAIRTVAGRGYQFTGEIRELRRSPDERTSAGVVMASTPLRASWIEPEDVAPVVVFRAPEAARMVTGASYEVRGGDSTHLP